MKIEKEIGGFIEGLLIGDDLIISHYTFTENQSSKPNSFIPDLTKRNNLVIGEFHSHNHGDIPSRKDDRAMFIRSLFLGRYILGIICLDSISPTITLYLYKRFRKRVCIAKYDVVFHQKTNLN